MPLKSLMNFFRFLLTNDHDNILKKKISKIQGKLVAENTISQIYFEYNELNHHSYLTVNITGFLQIETNKSCKLLFVGKEKILSVNSDCEMIEGQYGEREKIGLTKFDVNITSEVIDFVNSNTIKAIILEVRNGQVIHTTEQFKYTKIYQPAIISVIGSLD